ncbi:MAG: hypothetical protein V2A77_00695 [Pseudomonadota bacterium]
MRFKAVTKEELEKRGDILPKDKALIEELAGELEHTDAVRGYLVQQLDECVIDDQMRAEVSVSAAAFSDGWDAREEIFLKEVGDKWDSLYRHAAWKGAEDEESMRQFDLYIQELRRLG